MNTEERQRQALAEMREDEVHACLQLLPSAIQVVEEPSTGMVMLEAQDCFDTPFHLGEVLVTSAEVEWRDLRGHATMMGDRPGQAILAAALSVLRRLGETALIDKLEEQLSEPLARRRRRERIERGMVDATRVEFESMAEE